MRAGIIAIVAAAMVAAGAYIAWPHAWEAYLRATAPAVVDPPPDNYDPDFGDRPTTEWLATCKPSNDPYDWLGLKALCLSRFAERPEDAEALAPRLLEFTSSANGNEVAEAVLILGWFGHRPAAERIAGLLDSNDWRVVQAAARSLGWLGAKEALDALDHTAATHWLPQVRRAAATSATAIRTQTVLARPARLKGDNGFWQEMSFDYPDPGPACPSKAYRWQGKPIRLGQGASEIREARGSRGGYLETALVRPQGRLIGTDRGEWGGGLLWRPWFSRATVVHAENVFGLASSGGTTMGLFGSKHMSPYAYAAEIVIDDGLARLGPPIVLAGDANDLSVISPGLFAVRTDVGVAVFNSARVLGLAECAA